MPRRTSPIRQTIVLAIILACSVAYGAAVDQQARTAGQATASHALTP